MSADVAPDLFMSASLPTSAETKGAEGLQVTTFEAAGIEQSERTRTSPRALYGLALTLTTEETRGSSVETAWLVEVVVVTTPAFDVLPVSSFVTKVGAPATGFFEA